MNAFLLRMKRFCGYVVGFVFFLSGIIKLMDPVGAGLVMKEYFQFLHIGFMSFADTFFGVLFASAETLIGAALITGVWRKIVAIAAVALQGFFTFLTLILVIFQPQMDCGCFGEVIHLTHTETFVKNIILLALLLIYYIPEKHLGETKKKKYVSFGIVAVSAFAFSIYSLLYIPMEDFTDLHPGTSINRYSETSSDAFEAAFVYEKDGKEETFTLENLPDTTWTFVRTESLQPQKGLTDYTNISIYDSEGNYADSLVTDGKVILVSIYENSISEDRAREIKDFLDNAPKAGFKPLLLTASLESDLPYHYFCDYKTLVTLNRSSGGATYIDNGLIIRKWSKRALPTPEELATLFNEDSTETMIGRDTGAHLAFQGFLLYVFAVMLLL